MDHTPKVGEAVYDEDKGLPAKVEKVEGGYAVLSHPQRPDWLALIDTLRPASPSQEAMIREARLPW